jgi:hypothetical protein
MKMDGLKGGGQSRSLRRAMAGDGQDRLGHDSPDLEAPPKCNIRFFDASDAQRVGYQAFAKRADHGAGPRPIKGSRIPGVKGSREKQPIL